MIVFRFISRLTRARWLRLLVVVSLVGWGVATTTHGPALAAAPELRVAAECDISHADCAAGHACDEHGNTGQNRDQGCADTAHCAAPAIVMSASSPALNFAASWDTVRIRPLPTAQHSLETPPPIL